jgi:hypothetical protein
VHTGNNRYAPSLCAKQSIDDETVNNLLLQQSKLMLQVSVVILQQIGSNNTEYKLLFHKIH